MPPLGRPALQAANLAEATHRATSSAQGGVNIVSWKREQLGHSTKIEGMFDCSELCCARGPARVGRVLG